MQSGMQNQESHKEIDGRLDLKVLPLTMCLYMVMAGVLASWIVSWFLPVQLGRAWGFLGIMLVTGAYLNIKWCFRIFVAAKTNTNTTKPALAIVDGGPFRFSRNPMYLSYVIAYCGVSLIANSWAMLSLTPVFMLWITQWIILPEESYLEKYFGEEYLKLKQRTRRWL